MLVKNTGLIPDPKLDRERELAECMLTMTAPSNIPEYHIQPIPFIHEQPKFPSCVGEGSTSRAEGVLNDGSRFSGVQLWWDARRRDGKGEDWHVGSTLVNAIQSIQQRGLAPYAQGEEYSENIATGRMLFKTELKVTKYRQLNSVHWRIDPMKDPEERIITALLNNMLVFEGSGANKKLMQRRPTHAYIPAAIDEMHNSLNGHAQGIAGYWQHPKFGNLFLIQGSWGTTFAGCYTPDGTFQPGCYWMYASVLPVLWDIHALEIKVQR